MTILDEGVIKYHCHWIASGPISEADAQTLNRWRDRLYAQNFIGQYPNGIGYGNLSLRDPQNPQHILISGTQTGHLPHLTPQHYTRITSWDLLQNQLTCNGPIQASSESLTHATLYQADPNIQAIIHIHSAQLWQGLMHQVPTTQKDVPYGTPAMALEMERLLRETDMRSRKILVMAGHEDGIISFGQNLTEAYDVLMTAASVVFGDGYF